MISGITIVCREVDKNTGAVASYVCKKNVDDCDIHIASIRSRLNPGVAVLCNPHLCCG